MPYTDESDNEKPSYTCAVCNTTWKAKKAEGLPQRCPHCKSKLWKECFRHRCIKCRYTWISANPNPLKCPSCLSASWQEEVKDTGDVSKPVSERDLRRRILRRYDAGTGCLRISIALGITFSDVYDIIKDTYPERDVKI